MNDHRPILPPKKSGFPIGIVLAVAVIGVLLIAVAILASAVDDDSIDVTPIPPALLEDTEIVFEQFLYTTESIPFYISAGTDLTSDDQSTEVCGQVMVTPQQGTTDTISFFDGENHWIYVTRTDNLMNGWVPLSILSLEEPSGC